MRLSIESAFCYFKYEINICCQKMFSEKLCITRIITSVKKFCKVRVNNYGFFRINGNSLWISYGYVCTKSLCSHVSRKFLWFVILNYISIYYLVLSLSEIFVLSSLKKKISVQNKTKQNYIAKSEVHSLDADACGMFLLWISDKYI